MSKPGLGQETFLRQKRWSPAMAQVEGVESEKHRCPLLPNGGPAVRGWAPRPLPGWWAHLWDSVSSSIKWVHASSLPRWWGCSGIEQERKPGVAGHLRVCARLFCVLG